MGTSDATNYKSDDKDVIDKLHEFEWETLNDTGVRHISGGFAEADIFDYDDEYFDIELKWGIQSDCENVCHTEQYKMDRKTLEITDS